MTYPLWRHNNFIIPNIQEIQRGTLTTSIFGCPNALKWVTLSSRAWSKDEKNGMVRHDWVNSSRDICFFKSKYGKIRHFRYDVIFFYVDIFEKGFLYLKVLVAYFQKMYRFNTIGQTVDEINAFEMSKKCYFLLSQHFFCIFLRFQMHLSRERYARSIKLYIFLKYSMRSFR